MSSFLKHTAKPAANVCLRTPTSKRRPHRSRSRSSRSSRKVTSSLTSHHMKGRSITTTITPYIKDSTTRKLKPQPQTSKALDNTLFAAQPSGATAPQPPSNVQDNTYDPLPPVGSNTDSNMNVANPDYNASGAGTVGPAKLRFSGSLSAYLNARSFHRRDTRQSDDI